MGADECPVLHFPTECQQCKHIAGMPYMVQTIAGNGVTVSMRCLECGYVWDCTLKASPTYALTPEKP